MTEQEEDKVRQFLKTKSQEEGKLDGRGRVVNPAKFDEVGQFDFGEKLVYQYDEESGIMQWKSYVHTIEAYQQLCEAQREYIELTKEEIIANINWSETWRGDEILAKEKVLTVRIEALENALKPSKLSEES